MNLYVDGGCKHNGTKKQKATACLVVGSELIGKWDIGSYTSNEAEFVAVEKAFEWINVNKPEGQKIVWSDSRLVVNILNQTWHPKEPRIINLATRLFDILPTDTSVLWMSRNTNKAGQILQWGSISGEQR